MYHSGTWRAVCDDSWDHNDAKVVCQMLGYRFTINILYISSKIFKLVMCLKVASVTFYESLQKPPDGTPAMCRPILANVTPRNIFKERTMESVKVILVIIIPKDYYSQPVVKYLNIFTLYSNTIVMAELFKVPTRALERQAAVIFGWMT